MPDDFKQRMEERAAAPEELRKQYGLRELERHPRNHSGTMLVLTRDRHGNTNWSVAHFAQDLSGEEQPPFSGFYLNAGWNVQVDEALVIGWRWFERPGEHAASIAEILRTAIDGAADPVTAIRAAIAMLEQPT